MVALILPAQLRGDPTSSGLLGAQLTATALLAEIKAMSMAGSVQGTSTNAIHQDVLPMATFAARLTSGAIEHQAHLISVLLIALSQAMDHVARRDKSAFSESARELVEQGFAGREYDLDDLSADNAERICSAELARLGARQRERRGPALRRLSL